MPATVPPTVPDTSPAPTANDPSYGGAVATVPPTQVLQPPVQPPVTSGRRHHQSAGGHDRRVMSPPVAALARSSFPALGTTRGRRHGGARPRRRHRGGRGSGRGRRRRLQPVPRRQRSVGGEPGAGGPVVVSGTLLDAVEVALGAAAATDGLVDPTIGRACGCSATTVTSSSSTVTGPPLRAVVTTVPGWRAVRVDRDGEVDHGARGVELDLGATAKAWCADRAAAAAAARCGTGVLVSLGGDIAVAGPVGRRLGRAAGRRARRAAGRTGTGGRHRRRRVGHVEHRAAPVAARRRGAAPPDRSLGPAGRPPRSGAR